MVRFDGTQFFSVAAPHCENCFTRTSKARSPTCIPFWALSCESELTSKRPERDGRVGRTNGLKTKNLLIS